MTQTQDLGLLHTQLTSIFIDHRPTPQSNYATRGGKLHLHFFEDKDPLASPPISNKFLILKPKVKKGYDKWMEGVTAHYHCYDGVTLISPVEPVPPFNSGEYILEALVKDEPWDFSTFDFDDTVFKNFQIEITTVRGKKIIKGSYDLWSSDLFWDYVIDREGDGIPEDMFEWELVSSENVLQAPPAPIQPGMVYITPTVSNAPPGARMA